MTTSPAVREPTDGKSCTTPGCPRTVEPLLGRGRPPTHCTQHRWRERREIGQRICARPSCGNPIPSWKRADAKWCSAKCANIVQSRNAKRLDQIQSVLDQAKRLEYTADYREARPPRPLEGDSADLDGFNRRQAEHIAGLRAEAERLWESVSLEMLIREAEAVERMADRFEANPPSPLEGNMADLDQFHRDQAEYVARLRRMAQKLRVRAAGRSTEH